MYPVSVKQNFKKLKQVWLFLNVPYATVYAIFKFCVIMLDLIFFGGGRSVFYTLLVMAFPVVAAGVWNSLRQHVTSTCPYITVRLPQPPGDTSRRRCFP